MSSNGPGTFSIHQIKRAARKEANKPDSFNPFAKRNNTWAPKSKLPDIETGLAGSRNKGQDDGSPLSTVVTEPIMTRATAFHDPTQEGTLPRSKDGEIDTTQPKGLNQRSEDSEATVVPTRTSSSRPVSQEVKARRKFVNLFKKNKEETSEEEDDDEEKKRPWYKGKVLKHDPFTLKNQLSRTIFNSWVNILLICAPVGIILNYLKVNGTAVFVVNFIAIIPLAGMLSFATEEIALHVGESMGGLLNASFGNAVEMIVAIIALAKGNVIVVQTSLIGSILSNLLLVMGMCFFFGGLRRTEQFFNVTVAQTAASLLALAVGAVIIPTCFDRFSNADSAPQASVAALSRGTAIILLVVYGGYLYFQLKTHSDMFNEESKKVAMRPRKHALPQGALAKGIASAGGLGAGPGRAQMRDPSNDDILRRTAYEDEEDEPELPQLHIAVAWATLAGATAIIGLCAEFMVDGISAITSSGAISVEFVGLILLPIVGNAAEHATAVTVACKDKMDLAIGVAVGSSMQVALLLIPLMVVIGWIMGNDNMTLSFDGFQVAVLFVAVLLVNYLIGDGKSHWLEGMLLQCLYLIIAVCAWYYPSSAAGAAV